MAPRQTASEKVWTDLAYVLIAVAMMAAGGGLFVWAIQAGQTQGALGFGPLHALGAVLVSLGVALFLYRVLNQKNPNKLMSVGGSAAGSLGMFGLLFVMEDRSVDFFNKVHPPPAAATSAAAAPTTGPAQDAKLRIVAHLDNPNALDGNAAFHGREMRLQVTDPWATDLIESTIDDTGWVAFSGYNADGGTEHMSAELRPHALTPLKTEVYQRYAAQFCVHRKAPSWSAVRQITVNCKLGGVCTPNAADTTLGPCQDSGKVAWAGPLLSLIAPAAQAAPVEPAPAGWVVPDLEGACIANQRLGETFYRFDVATGAPAKAATFHYALRVNGNPVYVDGERDPRMRRALSGGAARLSFALQNLEFSGAAGPIGGQEKIDLALQFYDAGGREVGRKVGDYFFVALRKPKAAASGDLRWTGAYVLGKSGDGREILIASTGTPNADMKPFKTQFDALGLTYVGASGRLNGRFPVVAVVRPFLAKEDKSEPNARDGMPGLNLGLVMPDGRVRFTFSQAELKGLLAWYNAERLKHPLTRAWQDGYQYGLRGDGTVTPKAAGCAA